MQPAKLEPAQAKQEKDFAEQAACHAISGPYRQVQSCASLMRRSTGLSKNSNADARPEAKMVSSRFSLYKAEEQELISGWIERTEYGEQMPEGEGEAFRAESDGKSLQAQLSYHSDISCPPIVLSYRTEFLFWIFSLSSFGNRAC